MEPNVKLWVGFGVQILNLTFGVWKPRVQNTNFSVPIFGFSGLKIGVYPGKNQGNHLLCPPRTWKVHMDRNPQQIVGDPAGS